MSRKFDVAGLTQQQVDTSRTLHGANTLPTPEAESFMTKLRGNFNNPLIRVLMIALAATVILAIFGYASPMEGIGIALSVFLATFVATYSEFKNEESFQALQEQANAIRCRVFRDGNTPVQTEIANVVVGDYVLLQAGDKIPADGVMWAGSIKCNQMALNGESKPVMKSRGRGPLPPLAHDVEPDLLDIQRVFRGATVSEGEGVMLVERVGVTTIYGDLAKKLAQSDDTREPPLKVKLAALADRISTLGKRGAMLIAISFLIKQILADNNYSLGGIITYFSRPGVWIHDMVTAGILGIIIVVVAVPEGLPMMIAIVLSLNMRKLLARKVLVRRLMGIETAGCLDLLFADKTGTITEGVFLPQSFMSGYLMSYTHVHQIPVSLRSVLSFAVRESSSSTLTADPSSPHKFTAIGGNASDQALLTFLGAGGIRECHDNKDHSVPTLQAEVLFNSVNKFSAAQVRMDTQAAFATMKYSGDNDWYDNRSGRSSITLVKGAPERLIESCARYYNEDGQLLPLTNTAPLLAELSAMSERGMRLIGIATSRHPLITGDNINGSNIAGVTGYVDMSPSESKSSLVSPAGIGLVAQAASDLVDIAPPKRSLSTSSILMTPRRASRDDSMNSSNNANSGNGSDDEEVERVTPLPRNLSLIGVVAVADRVRPSSRAAIQTAHDAGIQVVMVTGDRMETAIAVARDIGLLDRDGDQGDAVITSEQMRAKSTDELLQLLPRLRVVARALPADKSRLVQLGQMSSVPNRRHNDDDDDADIDMDHEQEMMPLTHTSSTMNGNGSGNMDNNISMLNGNNNNNITIDMKDDRQSSHRLASGPGSGRVVGMTGDGVNDSAALKRADVSFAMGSGSEVAKEASDIVILDDDFKSILQASLYGRTIFKTIRKFVVQQSTINFASTVLVFVGPFLGFDFPLTLIQLLWLNIVMDTLTALAFGGEAALDRYMREKPVHRDANIINRPMWNSIIVGGMFMACYSFYFLTADSIQLTFAREALHETPPVPDEVHDAAASETPGELHGQGGEVFLTAFFCFFIFLCAFNAFNVRTSRMNLMSNLWENRGFVIVIGVIFVVQIVFTEIGGSMLRTVPLTMYEFMVVLAMASFIIPFDLARKALIMRCKRMKVLAARKPRH